MAIVWKVSLELSGIFSWSSNSFSPLWTDLTALVLTPPTPVGKSAQVDDGRADEEADTTPSAFSFTLDNRSGNFTPANSGSAYYPHVKPGVPVKLEATINATTVGVFYGFVDSWSPYLGDRNFGLCDVTAADALARFGTTLPLRSIPVEEYLSTSPAFYAPLNDPTGTSSLSMPKISGSAAALGVLKQTSGALAGGASYALGAPGPPGDTSGALTISQLSATSGVAYGVNYAVQPTLGATAYSVTVWVKVKAHSPAGRPLVMLTANNEPIAVEFSTTSGTTYVATVVGGTTSTRTALLMIPPSWVPLVIQVTASGSSVTANLYVAGTHYTGSTATATLTSTSIASVMIGGQILSTNVGSHLYPADYAHFAGWAAPQDWTDLYTAVKNAFSGESTQARIARLVGYRAPAVPVLNNGTYTGHVGVQQTAGQPLQQAMFDAAHAEMAPVGIDGLGRVSPLLRSQMTSPTSALTLDCRASGITVDLLMPEDTSFIVNRYEVTAASGSTFVAEDTTSQHAYGYYADSLSAPIWSDTDAQTIANTVVSQLKDPTIGAGKIVFDLFALEHDNAALALSVAQLRMGAVVTLTNVPAPFPTPLVVMLSNRSWQFDNESSTLTWTVAATATGVIHKPVGAVG